MADLLSFLNEKEEDPLQLFSLIIFLSLSSVHFLRRSWIALSLFLAPAPLFGSQA